MFYSLARFAKSSIASLYMNVYMHVHVYAMHSYIHTYLEAPSAKAFLDAQGRHGVSAKVNELVFLSRRLDSVINVRHVNIVHVQLPAQFA